MDNRIHDLLRQIGFITNLISDSVYPEYIYELYEDDVLTYVCFIVTGISYDLLKYNNSSANDILCETSDVNILLKFLNEKFKHSIRQSKIDKLITNE